MKINNPSVQMIICLRDTDQTCLKFSGLLNICYSHKSVRVFVTEASTCDVGYTGLLPPPVCSGNHVVVVVVVVVVVFLYDFCLSLCSSVQLSQRLRYASDSNYN